MRTQRWIGWIVTGLMAALLLLSAVPDVLRIPGAVLVFNHLGYPSYLLLFLGTAKILGVLAVLLPGLRRIKEWAFAGLTFDVTGALYSHLSVGDPPSAWATALIALGLVGGSYVAYRLRSRDLVSESRGVGPIEWQPWKPGSDRTRESAVFHREGAAPGSAAAGRH